MATTTALPRCPVCGLEHEGAVPATCTRPSCGVELLPGSGDLLKVKTFQLTSHYSLCVLPFAFAEAEDRRIVQKLTDSGRWKERRFSLDSAADVDRTEYFLPYIRRFLFPGLFERTPAPPEGRPRQACWHFLFDLSRLGETNADGLVLTMNARDNQKKMDFVYPLLLEKAELIVFSYRVAFLVFHFRSREEAASYFDQMNALSYLRSFAPLYQGFELPELVSGSQRFRMTQLLPYLLAEFDTGTFPTSPASVSATAPLPVKPTYDDRMMVYTFSCIDKETAPPAPDRCHALLQRGAVINFDSEAVNRPTEGKADNEDTRAWLHNRWQSFSKDGGSLVVFNTDRFHARFLGTYHRTYYFDIFLLAALQRVTLLNLFESFSDIQTLITGSNASRQLLRRVRRDLLLFKNQCWFSQITNRERGLVLWKKWQKIFETRTLLKEVNEQSDELNTYLQNRYRERIEWLVRLGGFLAAAVPVIFGLERFLGSQEWVGRVRWVLLAVLLIGTAAFGWYVLFKDRDEV
jgi:hypothetical protein